MSILLKCEKCEKQMGSLEPFIIRDEKYLCKTCGTAPTDSADAVKEFYEKFDDSIVIYSTADSGVVGTISIDASGNVTVTSSTGVLTTNIAPYITFTSDNLGAINTNLYEYRSAKQVEKGY
jgi:hypothetical protein